MEKSAEQILFETRIVSTAPDESRQVAEAGLTAQAMGGVPHIDPPIRSDIDVVSDFEAAAGYLPPAMVEEVRARQRAIAGKKNPPNSDIWHMRF